MNTVFDKYILLKVLVMTTSAILGMSSVEARAMDLQQIYSIALQQDATLQLAKQNYLIETQSAKLGEALLKPVITAQARFGRTRYRSDSPDFSNALSSLPAANECFNNIIGCIGDVGRAYNALREGDTDSRYTVSDYGVTLAQPLFDKERWHQYKKAQLLDTRGAIVYKQAQGDLVYRATKSYISALQALANLEQAEAEHVVLRQQLKFAQSQLSAGLGRASNLYELRSADQLKTTHKQLLKTALDGALAELSGLAARPLSVADLRPFRIPIPVNKLVPANKNEWQSLANQFNLQLLDAGIDIRLAGEEYAIRKGARLPKVNFIASYNKTDTSGGQGFIPGADVAAYGVDISAPLYQGGAIGVNQKKAQHQYEATKQRLRQQQSQLAVAIDAIYNQIDGQVKTYQVLQKALQTALRSQKNLDAGAAKGIVTVAEVLQGRRNISQLRANLKTTGYEYLLSKLKLRQLTGVLDERDLVAINNLLAHG